MKYTGSEVGRLKTDLAAYVEALYAQERAVDVQKPPPRVAGPADFKRLADNIEHVLAEAALLRAARTTRRG